MRGCPFHNAAVEAAGDIPAVANLVARHKRAFRDRLADVAAQAGAADPHALGAQLAVLFEGAAALSASCNDTQVAGDARRAAATLIQAALLPAGTATLAPQGHTGPVKDLAPRAGAASSGHPGEKHQ